MWSALQVAIAPLYAQEAARIRAELTNMYSAESGGAELVRYMAPLSDQEFSKLDFSAIHPAHYHAYNIPGSRAYWQKLMFLKVRHMGRESNYSEKTCRQAIISRSIGRDDAIKSGNIGSLSERKAGDCWCVALGELSPELFHSFHGSKVDFHIDELFLDCSRKDLKRSQQGAAWLVSTYGHQDLLRLVPRVRELHLKHAVARDIDVLLKRYSWASLKTLKLSNTLLIVNECPTLNQFLMDNRQVSMVNLDSKTIRPLSKLLKF
jgi:hypothetical protein